MIINGKNLLIAAPIVDMVPVKTKFKGTSYGLSEAGYDIRIKQNVSFYHPHTTPFIMVDGELAKGSRFILASGIEKFQMPNNLVGTVKDKSTWARKGLSVFNTVIEPKWNGFLTLELVYHGSEDLHIEAGQGIAQILFNLLSEQGDYGDGKYQNQGNEPIEAKD